MTLTDINTGAPADRVSCSNFGCLVFALGIVAVMWAWQGFPGIPDSQHCDCSCEQEADES